MRRHVQTLAPYAWHAMFPPRAPEPVHWQTTLVDPQMGKMFLTGHLREQEGARDLYVLCHGLGGSVDSIYCLRGAAAVARHGQSSLALSLRGSDRLGEDFYNIALVDDLHAAVASPAFDRYERIFVVGYSMGGYVTMHYARDPKDPRVKACAAICSPISLLAAQVFIDSAVAWIYRRHVLNGLIGIYEEVAKRKPVPTDVREVRRVKTIYDWDRLTIAPRYGYDSPEHYYEELSIEPHLGDLQIPVLHLASRRDPIIPARTIEPFVGKAGEPYDLRWVDDGGHVNFSSRFEMGIDGGAGLEGQLFAWFEALG